MINITISSCDNISRGGGLSSVANKAHHVRAKYFAFAPNLASLFGATADAAAAVGMAAIDID
jgi:hypothetical protein